MCFKHLSHINSNFCSCENYVSSTENLCFFFVLLSDKNDGQLQWWEDSRLLFLNKTMAVSNAISFIFCELSAPSLASRLICGLLLQQMAAKSVAHVNLQGQSIPLHSFTVGAVRNECALEFFVPHHFYVPAKYSCISGIFIEFYFPIRVTFVALSYNMLLLFFRYFQPTRVCLGLAGFLVACLFGVCLLFDLFACVKVKGYYKGSFG